MANDRRTKLLVILSMLLVWPLIFIQFWTVEPEISGFDYTVYGIAYTASTGWPFPYETTYSSFHSGEIFEQRFSWFSLQTNAGILFALLLAILFSLNYVSSQESLRLSDLLALLAAVAVSIVAFLRCQMWTESNHWSLYYGTADVRPNYPEWPFWVALAIFGTFVYSLTGHSLRRIGIRSSSDG